MAAQHKRTGKSACPTKTQMSCASHAYRANATSNSWDKPEPDECNYLTVQLRYILIPQRLAGFERMRDALLRFAFAAEGDEGFAFEIEDVLLADQLGSAERATGEDVGQLARDQCIVFRYKFAA